MTSAKKNNNKISFAGFLFVLAGALLFSTKAIFVKLAFAHTSIDVVGLLFLRMLFALPFYLVAARISYNKTDKQPISQKQWIYIVLIGLFGYYLSSLLDFIGLKFISAGLERLILFLYPTFVVLINSIILKTKITKIQLLALLLTYTGIGIAFLGELKLDTSNEHFYFGAFMIFLCAITFATYLVGSDKLVKKIGVTQFTAYSMLASTVGVVIHFLLVNTISKIEWSSTVIYYSIALAIFATVLPSFLMNNGIKRIGSNNAAIITSIGPVSTVLQAHYLLGEPLFFEQLFGTVLVIAGIVLIGWKSNVEE